MRRLNPIFTLFFLTLVVACAQLGIPSPTTFNEKLAVTIGLADEVVKDTTMALQAKKITPDDAQNVANAADAAKTGIGIARSLNAANPSAANAKLDAIRTSLLALQTYLVSRGIAK